MSERGFHERVGTALAIRGLRRAVAEEVTNEFLVRHPEWEVRYGESARQFGIEDAGYHLDFLAAAIESGEVETFNEYGDWAASMLVARHIEPHFLAENLEQIGQALCQRLPETDREMVEFFIRSGMERCLRGGAAGELPPPGKLAELTAVYTDAALGGRRQAATNLLLEAVRQGHAVIDIYGEVLQGASYRIGRLWQEHKITVAQEHMATAITQFAIAQLYPLIESAGTFRGKGVITGVQGEFHQVGSNMVADMLEADGWDIRFLGTDVPVDHVLGAIEEHEADMLGISATMLPNIPKVARLIDAVRARSGSQIRILLGGRAFRSAPMLYKELGADGYARDLRLAVSLARDLAASEESAVGETVLITDDDPGVRKYLGHVLRHAGYRVLEAEDGNAAMRALQGQAVHLVLMDLIMPDQEGLETIPLIKAGFPSTRILAMSGAFGGTFLLAAKALGANDALAKPIEAEVLLQAVRRVLAA
jgi:methanogenic corrinoid protein MtbC1